MLHLLDTQKWEYTAARYWSDGSAECCCEKEESEREEGEREMER